MLTSVLLYEFRSLTRLHVKHMRRNSRIIKDIQIAETDLHFSTHNHNEYTCLQKNVNVNGSLKIKYVVLNMNKVIYRQNYNVNCIYMNI